MNRYVLLFFFLLVQSSNAFVINEFMYDPEGDDNNNEYVEIILDYYINLTDYRIQDLNSEDNLTELKHVDNNFALIVEEGFNFTDVNASVYDIGATIGNGLNNDNDLIILKYPNDTILDVVSYNDNWGASGNNKSLCRIPDNKGLWKECSKTIGYGNLVTADFSAIKINEFLPNPIGDDDSSMPDGEWVELFNNGNNDLDLTGLELIDDNNHKIIISSINTITTIIKAKNYLTVYMNGASGFLNNEGLEKIKLYSENLLIEEISYSDNEEGLSWSKINDIWMITNPSPGEENKGDLESSDNIDLSDSSIEIDKVYDLGSNDKAEWGSNIRIKLIIYKGNTNKNSIQSYVEKNNKKISKISKTNVYGKFQNYTITLPIQLALNCNNKYEDGDYEIVVSGLDTEDGEEIKISGENKECNDINKENKTANKKESIKKEVFKENNISNNINSITGKVIYENKTKEASRLNVFIFIAFLIILSMVLMYERKNPG